MDSKQALQVVEAYLQTLNMIYKAGSGMTEMAYYPALADLLNEIGRTLQPQVHCLLHFKNIRSTLPDGGLFTTEQFSSPADYDSLPRTPPTRGVVVVKSPGDDLEEIMRDPLLSRYLKRYGRILVTNYRAFVSIRLEPQEPTPPQSGYTLAGNEADFWHQLAHPRQLARHHASSLVRYLEQALGNASSPATREEQGTQALSSAPSTETEGEVEATLAEADPEDKLPQTEYFSWPQLSDLFATAYPASKTGREIDLSDLDLSRLEKRLEAYFDRSLADEAAGRLAPGLMASARDYDAPGTRQQLLPLGLESGTFVKYAYRPFDLRHFYVHPESQLLDERQRRLATLAQANNGMLVSRKKAGKEREGVPLYFTSTLVDRHLTHSGTVCFPVTLKGRLHPQQSLFEGLDNHIPTNFSALAHKYLVSLGLTAPDIDEETASLLAFHILAVAYSPHYLLENEEFLGYGWPRFPLPDNLATIRKSSAWGSQLAALLDPETTIPQVTTRQLRPELKGVGVLTGVDDETVDPELAVANVWVSSSQGETAADQGYLVERDYTASERALIEKGAALLGLTLDQLDTALGLTTCDIYLSDQVYWANVPLRVWEYTIGGYPVLREWLALRQENVLGRPLRLEEVREFTRITHRLTVIALLGPALDANYEAVKQAAVKLQ